MSGTTSACAVETTHRREAGIAETPLVGITMSIMNWSTLNKVGLVMQFLFGLANLPSAFMPPDTGTKAGPPMSVLWADTVLGVILIVAITLAWRNRSRGAATAGSVASALIAATGIPAFFVDVPAGIKALVAASIAWAIVSIVLTFTKSKATSA
jgi:uncharacterized membrane protein (UPF0136 family)